MDPENDRTTENNFSSETIFSCFVSGAKFGMIVAVLTFFLSMLSQPKKGKHLMEVFNDEGLHELTSDQIEQVSGGVILVPALYVAFVSGAKWGAGIAVATYAIHVKLR